MTANEIYSALQKVHKSVDAKEQAIRTVKQCLEAIQRGETVDVASLIKMLDDSLK